MEKGRITCMEKASVTAKGKPTPKTEAAPKAAVQVEAVAPVVTAPVAKQEPVKKAPAAKKTVAKKTATKKTPIKESLVIELQDKSYSQAELVKIAKDVWKYDLKRKVGDFKEVELFVKPEEATVYYIINKKEAGSFFI